LLGQDLTFRVNELIMTGGVGSEGVNGYSLNGSREGGAIISKEDVTSTYEILLDFPHLEEILTLDANDKIAVADVDDLRPSGDPKHKYILASNILSSVGGVPESRTISTTAPLIGGGDLSANRTLGLAGLTTVGSAGNYIRSTGTTWEYRTPAQVLTDIGGFLAENKAGLTIQAGQPVTIHSSGSGVVLAQANSLSNCAVGVAAEQIAAGNTGRILLLGPLQLADWTSVTGTVTLTAKGKYYLVPSTAGLLTTTHPTANPDVLQFLGYALSTNIMFVQVGRGIGL